MKKGYRDTNKKLLACACLKTLKRDMTYRELSKKIKLPPGVINRYVNGYVLPNTKRAHEIINNFVKNFLTETIISKSKVKGSNYYVTTDILSQPFLLNVIANWIIQRLDNRVTLVLTAASDGIPLAITLAHILNVEACWAKKTQEISPHGHFISNNLTQKAVFTPLCLPKHKLTKHDHVLIVDDVIRGGTTILSLIDLCGQAGASVEGVFSIFIGKRAEKTLIQYNPRGIVQI